MDMETALENERFNSLVQDLIQLGENEQEMLFWVDAFLSFPKEYRERLMKLLIDEKQALLDVADNDVSQNNGQDASFDR